MENLEFNDGENDFEPKEDINFFLRFDKEVYSEDPENSIMFSITDNKGNILHEGSDLTNISDDALIILGNALIAMLDNVIEPELDKRDDEYFSKDLDKEIKDLIYSCGMKEGK